MKSLLHVCMPNPAKLSPADREKIADYMEVMAEVMRQGNAIDFGPGGAAFDVHDTGEMFAMRHDHIDNPNDYDSMERVDG